MKNYCKPELEVLLLQDDLIATSGASDWLGDDAEGVIGDVY